MRCYRIFANSIVLALLVLLAGCATPGTTVNGYLNDYMKRDEVQRYLLLTKGAKVCCFSAPESSLTYTHTPRTLLDIYGDSLAFSQGFWESNQSTSWFGCGPSRESVEANAESKTGEKTYALFCKTPSTPQDRGYYYLSQAKSEIKARRENARAAAALAEQKKAEAEARIAQVRRSDTCRSFGFTEGGESFSKCMFELYKLERQSEISQAAISQAKAAQASNAATQQQLLNTQQKMLEEQQFIQGMRQLQDAANMINPPQTTCKWNPVTYTMVCR